MYQAGLVLEGGGLKGIYTAGVLDYFLEQGLEFANNYGVSAGAIMLCSFVSRQKGRLLLSQPRRLPEEPLSSVPEKRRGRAD